MYKIKILLFIVVIITTSNCVHTSDTGEYAQEQIDPDLMNILIEHNEQWKIFKRQTWEKRNRYCFEY